MSLRASEASVAISISPGHAKCCSVIKKSMQSRGGASHGLIGKKDSKPRLMFCEDIIQHLHHLGTGDQAVRVMGSRLSPSSDVWDSVSAAFATRTVALWVAGRSKSSIVVPRGTV